MRREIFYGNAVKVAIADAAAETAIATPRSVRCYNDLETKINWIRTSVVQALRFQFHSSPLYNGLSLCCKRRVSAVFLRGPR